MAFLDLNLPLFFLANFLVVNHGGRLFRLVHKLGLGPPMALHISFLEHNRMRLRNGCDVDCLYKSWHGGILIPTLFPLSHQISCCSNLVELKYKASPMDARTLKMVQFEDLLPIMAKNLGGEGLINELCNGFQLLMDGDKGVITYDSLKRNSALLGLLNFQDDEIESMIKEGDMDGDGVLNQLEFCILMFRLSPELIDGAERLMEEAFLQDLMP